MEGGWAGNSRIWKLPEDVRKGKIGKLCVAPLPSPLHFLLHVPFHA